MFSMNISRNNQNATILKIIKISRNCHRRFTANYSKFLANHSIHREMRYNFTLTFLKIWKIWALSYPWQPEEDKLPYLIEHIRHTTQCLVTIRAYFGILFVSCLRWVFIFSTFSISWKFNFTVSTYNHVLWKLISNFPNRLKSMTFVRNSLRWFI